MLPHGKRCTFNTGVDLLFGNFLMSLRTTLTRHLWPNIHCSDKNNKPLRDSAQFALRHRDELELNIKGIGDGASYNSERKDNTRQFAIKGMT